MVLNDGSLLRHIQGYTGEMCVTVLTPHLTAYMPAGSVHFVLTLDGDAAVCGFPVFDPTESKAMRETAALRLARSGGLFLFYFSVGLEAEDIPQRKVKQILMSTKTN